MDSFNQKLTRKYKGKQVGTGTRARTRNAYVWPPDVLRSKPTAAAAAHLIITVRLAPKRFASEPSYFENRIIIFRIIIIIIIIVVVVVVTSRVRI